MRIGHSLALVFCFVLPLTASAQSLQSKELKIDDLPIPSRLCEDYCNDMDGDESGMSCKLFCLLTNEPGEVAGAVCGLTPSLLDPKVRICGCHCVFFDDLPPQLAGAKTSKDAL